MSGGQISPTSWGKSFGTVGAGPNTAMPISVVDTIVEVDASAGKLRSNSGTVCGAPSSFPIAAAPSAYRHRDVTVQNIFCLDKVRLARQCELKRGFWLWTGDHGSTLRLVPRAARLYPASTAQQSTTALLRPWNECTCLARESKRATPAQFSSLLAAGAQSHVFVRTSERPSWCVESTVRGRCRS